MTFGVADLVENLRRLQADIIARVVPSNIEVGSDHLVDAGGGFALHFELGSELRGEVFVEKLLVTVDFDAKEIAPDNWNDEALGDRLQKLVPLFSIVTHASIQIVSLALACRIAFKSKGP
jgi:hypothetical protein